MIYEIPNAHPRYIRGLAVVQTKTIYEDKKVKKSKVKNLIISACYGH